MKYILALLLIITAVSAKAEPLKIAVASNFLVTMKQLVAEYQRQHQQAINISAASTGKLFVQITHGAPYDLFFSADAKRADLLVKQGFASHSVEYAIGQLVYVAKEISAVDCRASLNRKPEKKIAMANPKTAPYGLAAKQVLIKLGRWNALKSSLVMGENILQAYQFISTGSAGSGFIAASIAVNADKLEGYCQWQVPTNLYSPVQQKMVILSRAKDNSIAKDFYRFIRSETAREIIINNGYR